MFVRYMESWALLCNTGLWHVKGFDFYFPGLVSTPKIKYSVNPCYMLIVWRDRFMPFPLVFVQDLNSVRQFYHTKIDSSSQQIFFVFFPIIFQGCFWIKINMKGKKKKKKFSPTTTSISRNLHSVTLVCVRVCVCVSVSVCRCVCVYVCTHLCAVIAFLVKVEKKSVLSNDINKHLLHKLSYSVWQHISKDSFSRLKINLGKKVMLTSLTKWRQLWRNFLLYGLLLQLKTLL